MTKRVWVYTRQFDETMSKDGFGYEYPFGIGGQSAQFIDPSNLDPAMVERAVRAYTREALRVPGPLPHEMAAELNARCMSAALVAALTVEGEATEGGTSGYLSARGAIPFDPDAPLPEDVISRQRDEWARDDG